MGRSVTVDLRNKCSLSSLVTSQFLIANHHSTVNSTVSASPALSNLKTLEINSS